MGQIVVLDQNMINMIAAGEVIERPASVVKELLENSIDSGSSQITVSIEDGGKKLISVSDNGCGMDADDLGRAFESHATSKIKTSADLNRISTLGFRGEALSSIGSVGHVKAVSRRKGSDGDTCFEINCGQKDSVIPCSCDYGTTIEVRDLFYKLPARRKFLKTSNTESGHIIECFKRIALSNINIDMTLISNGREVYRLGGNQGLGSRITELFGSEISENLIESKSREKNIYISVLLGKANISRSNSNFQYIFLNGRYIRDKFIQHAIKEAYRGHLEQNRFPTIFLFIELDNEDFDVNVHPTKIEVRFYNANLVHSQILSCLREKLLSTNLDVEVKLSTASAGSQQIQEAMADFFNKYKPFQAQRNLNFVSQQGAGTSSQRDTEHKYPISEMQSEKQRQSKFLQIHDSFIVTETKEGFVIIDQHALHERIMYEQLKKRISEGKLESQKLLIPESFEVTEQQLEVIEKNCKLIEKLGIELNAFGPRTYAIHSFPVLLSKASPLEFVIDLLDLLTDKYLNMQAEDLLDEVLNMTACKGSIKAGQKLNDQEIEQLISDKGLTAHSSRCAHGRPTVIKFSLKELERQFQRT